MALKIVEKEISLTEYIPVIVVTYIDVISCIKRYHVYKYVWTPRFQEQVHGEREPNNRVDKYVVAV